MVRAGRKSRLRFALAAVALSACTCSRETERSGETVNIGGTGGVLLTGGSGGSDGFTLPTAGKSGTGGTAPTIESCLNAPASTKPVPPGFPTGAKRLPGLDPDVYVFEVPPDPKVLTWKDCGTGCRELVNTWAPSLAQGFYGNLYGGVVAGKPWLIVQQLLGAVGNVRTWIGPADGPAVRALERIHATGTVPHGSMSPAGIAEAGYLVSVHYHDEKYWVLGAAPLSAEIVCVATGGGLTTLRDAVFSDNRWAGLASYARVTTGPWPPDSVLPVQRLGLPPPLTDMSAVGVAGERFLISGYNLFLQQETLWYWTGAGSIAPFVAQPPQSESDYGAVSDGTTVVWLHGSGAHLDGGVLKWKKVELMRAPANAEPPVNAASVAVLPTAYVWGPLLVQGDYVLAWMYVSPTSEWPPSSGEKVPFLLRMSDLRAWIISNRSANVHWEDALYLSSEELALVEKTLKTYSAWMDTIVRYRIDSLGPGQPIEELTDAGAP